MTWRALCGRPAADPGPGGVREAAGAERLARFVQVPVQVADGYQALHRGPEQGTGGRAKHGASPSELKT
jgi:hypothetical protein